MHAWHAVLPGRRIPTPTRCKLLGDILSSGRSSRLYKRLVEKEQAALNVEAFPFLLENGGLLGVFATGQQGVTLDQLDALIDEEVEKVKAEGTARGGIPQGPEHQEGRVRQRVWHRSPLALATSPAITPSMEMRISSTRSWTATSRSSAKTSSVAAQASTSARMTMFSSCAIRRRQGAGPFKQPFPITPHEKATFFLLLAVAVAVPLPLPTSIAPSNRRPMPHPPRRFRTIAPRRCPMASKSSSSRTTANRPSTFRLLIRSGSVADGRQEGRGQLHRRSCSIAAPNIATPRPSRYETDSIGVKIEASGSEDAISVAAGMGSRNTPIASWTCSPMRCCTPRLRRTNSRASSGRRSRPWKPRNRNPPASRESSRARSSLAAFPTAITSSPRTSAPFIAKTWPPFTVRISCLTMPRWPSSVMSKPTPSCRSSRKLLASGKKAKCPRCKLPEMPGAPRPLRSKFLDRAPGSVRSNDHRAERRVPRGTIPTCSELNVMNATLGGGVQRTPLPGPARETRLDLRLDVGLRLRASSRAIFEATAETRNEVTGPARRGKSLKEIARIRDEPAKEWTRSPFQRQYNVGNYLLSLENSARTAQRVQDIDLYGLPADFYKTYAHRMSVVTPAQVEELAKKYLTAETTSPSWRGRRSEGEQDGAREDRQSYRLRSGFEAGQTVSRRSASSR